MNYKGILTDEVANQFKEEGVTCVLVSLFSGRELLRNIEVKLEKEEHKVLSVTGKSTAAQAALAKQFHGAPAPDGKAWYNFSTGLIICGGDPEKAVKVVAGILGVEIEELEWVFKIEH